MKAFWLENQILCVIFLIAAVAALYETRLPSDEPIEARLRNATDVLYAVYPEEPRLLYGRAIKAANAGQLDRSEELLETAFIAGFREEEMAFSLYIDIVMATRNEPELVRTIVDHWRRAYPQSSRLAWMQERLRQVRILP